MKTIAWQWSSIRNVLAVLLAVSTSGTGTVWGEVLAYIPQPTANQVTVVSADSNKVVARIAVGATPTGVAVSPWTQTVYITNTADGTVSVINMKTNRVTGTIKVGLAPVGIAVTSDARMVYVANSGDSTVSYFPTAEVMGGVPPENAVVHTISGLASEPYGVTASADGSAIYVSTKATGGIAVINTKTNTVTSSISTGPLPGAVLQTRVAVGTDCKTINCQPQTDEMVWSVGGSSLASVSDTQKRSLTPFVSVGQTPVALTAFPFLTRDVYVANKGSQSVTAVSANAISGENSLVYSTSDIPVGSSPAAISALPSGRFLWTANTDGTVSRIDTQNSQVTATIDVGAPGAAVGQFFGLRPDITDLQPATRGIADLGVSVDVAHSQVLVTNHGPNVAEAVSLINTLPAGVQFISARPTQGGCLTPMVGATGTIVCGLGALAPGATAVLTLYVGGNEGQVQSVVNSLFTDDNAPQNNVLTWAANQTRPIGTPTFSTVLTIIPARCLKSL